MVFAPRSPNPAFFRGFRGGIWAPMRAKEARRKARSPGPVSGIPPSRHILAPPIMATTMALHAHLILVLLLATVLTPLLGTVPLRGWRWDRQCWWLLGLLSVGMPLAVGHRFVRILL